MNKDLADITLVVDRSGSMQEIRSDAEGGINSFIEQQAQAEGQALITLVQFDTEYEFVHRAIVANDIPKYSLVPRGGTALLDAVGRAINETGARLAAMQEQDRPGLVAFVIATDGLENASCEFSRAQIKTMIEEQQSKYNWQFTFLGADQDAFAEARAMGMAAGGHANYAKQKVAAAYAGTSSKLRRMRQQVQNAETIDNSFTAEELEDMQ
ncbi:MAG: VWA domain-containing protein [Mariniblastus sp.]|nr:VWA domain-containing protein [Mariniblastus sp.]